MLKVDNEYTTWNQLVEKYPDQWGVVENAELTKGGFIKAGELIAVGNSAEVDDFVVECYKADRKIDYQRTTDARRNSFTI